MKDHEKEWDDIWSKRNLLFEIVSFGRRIYNGVFIVALGDLS